MDKDEIMLAILRENARTSVSDLARRLNVSRTAAQARLDKLERNGIIQGYSVKLAPSYEKQYVKALVMIKSPPQKRQLVERALNRVPALTSLYSISGAFDLAAVLMAQGVEELDSLIDEIGRFDGVTDTMSSVILSTKVER